MKVIIFGATGNLGSQVVEQALTEGHEVTAFSRNANKLQLANPKLHLVSGDVLNANDVQRALTEHDAVIIALGAGMNGYIRAAGTRCIIEGMEQLGIQRLICLSTLGAGDSWSQLNFFWKYIMFGWLLRDALEDHEEQERLIRNSNLDWIIVRPAAFTNGPATNDYKHGSLLGEKQLKLKISKRDLANFMLQGLKDNTYLHQQPGLSY